MITGDSAHAEWWPFCYWHEGESPTWEGSMPLKGELALQAELTAKYQPVFDLLAEKQIPVRGVRMKSRWLYLQAVAPTAALRDTLTAQTLALAHQIDAASSNEIICHVVTAAEVK